MHKLRRKLHTPPSVALFSIVAVSLLVGAACIAVAVKRPR